MKIWTQICNDFMYVIFLKGFNKEMEDIAKVQRSYSIPDVELRESLKRDNKEYILPKYNQFYETYVQ